MTRKAEKKDIPQNFRPSGSSCGLFGVSRVSSGFLIVSSESFYNPVAQKIVTSLGLQASGFMLDLFEYSVSLQASLYVFSIGSKPFYISGSCHVNKLARKTAKKTRLLSLQAQHNVDLFEDSVFP